MKLSSLPDWSMTMSDQIPVPDILIKDVGHLLTHYGTKPDSAVSTTDLPRDLVQSLIDYLGEDLGCDHAVNICSCTEAGVVAALKLALIGQRFCSVCHGDGVVFGGDDDGKVTCPTCEMCSGSGVVTVTR